MSFSICSGVDLRCVWGGKSTTAHNLQRTDGEQSVLGEYDTEGCHAVSATSRCHFQKDVLLSTVPAEVVITIIVTEAQAQKHAHSALGFLHLPHSNCWLLSSDYFFPPPMFHCLCGMKTLFMRKKTRRVSLQCSPLLSLFPAQVLIKSFGELYYVLRLQIHETPFASSWSAATTAYSYASSINY